jgi:general secretion pathway protein G
MSLVEIMVVIAIIVTLMSIVAFGAFTVFDDAKVQFTTLQMHQVSKRIELYSLKKGEPSTSDGLKTVYGDEAIPLDGWDREFVYVSPGPSGSPYELVSYGSDGTEGGTGNDADLKWSEVR